MLIFLCNNSSGKLSFLNTLLHLKIRSYGISAREISAYEHYAESFGLVPAAGVNSVASVK
jgi:hypothetical protein